MSFTSKSMQIMCITSSVVVMTSSVAMVMLELNCDNKIAANTMKNPYSNIKLDFSL